MSHHNMKMKRIVPLLFSCAMSLSSCTMSDQVTPAAATGLVTIGTPVMRSGVEGLRLDLEWARSAARDAAGRDAIGTGGATTSVSMDDLVTQLEAQLRLAEAPARAAAHGSTSVLRGLSPAPTPSFDYLDPADVNGATAIYSNIAPPATRVVTVYALTSCYTLPSMTVADLESKTTIRRFDTGEIRVWEWPTTAEPRPSYTSASWPWTVSGPPLYFTVFTRHYCQQGPKGQWPYRDTQGFAIV